MQNQFQLQSEIKNLMRIIPADIIDGKCVRLSKGLQHQDYL
jgi:hypothetical protein